MKTVFACLMLSLSCILSFAQKKIPAFGKIDVSDLIMKTCELDPEADAYKLIDIGFVRWTQGKNLFKTSTERRIRIKILKEKGISQGNVKIPFVSKLNTERIDDLEAVSYNLGPDQKVVITKLSKDAIFIQKVSNRVSTISFSIPEVKVGTVIEYKYVDLFENPAYLSDWNFQDDIPTRYSSYTAEIPQYFNFTKQLLVYQKVDQKTEYGSDRVNTAEGSLTYNTAIPSYVMENISGLKSEPFMSCLKDYQQRIQFQLTQVDFGNGSTIDYASTWPKLTKELMEDEDFGIQFKRNIPRTKDLDLLLAGVLNKYKKMQIIYDYVRANMSWNGGQSIYALDGVRSAWDKKTGTNAEINIILINLLRDADVPVEPLLVSSRDHGATNPLFPFIDQFNNVLAHVQIDEQKYVLNAADKYNPARLIPYDVLNTNAFLLTSEGGKWISLDNNSLKWKNTVLISADIDIDGTMKGEALINSFDYSRNPRTKRFLEKKGSFNEYFTVDNPNFKVEDITVANVEADSMPLEQKLKFSSKLNSSGDYRYFNVNMFTGLEKNPFISDSRLTDIDFGYCQSYGINGTIFLPEGYEVEALPKNISMIMPDTSITLKRTMQLDHNILNFKINVDFAKGYYTVEDYPYFKEFNKQLYTKLNEQIVLKKKMGTP